MQTDRGSKLGIAGLATIALLVLAQVFVRGWRPVLWLPLTLVGAITTVSLLFSVRDFVILRNRPVDSVTTFSAALLVSPSWPRWLRDQFSASRSRRLLRSSAESSLRGIGGYLDILSNGLRWRPGSVTRRAGIGPISLSWLEIESMESRSLYPGFGWLACLVSVNLTEGGMLEFWTRNKRRLALSLGPHLLASVPRKSNKDGFP